MTRREAREQAFVLIFERSISHDSTEEIIDAAEWSGEIFIDDFAEKTALGTEQNEASIDELIAGNIRGWTMSRLSKVSLALLRLAIYEFQFDKEVPVSVAINEAVELAKKYGGAEDAPFVNGVLGTIAKKNAGETDA